MAEHAWQGPWTVPDHVVFRRLEDEAILLNLDSELYFGLDAVGTAVWQAVVEHGTLDDAWAALAPQYDVDPAELRRDIVALLGELVEQGLLQAADG